MTAIPSRSAPSRAGLRRDNFVKELKNKSKLSFRVDKEGKSYCVRWNTFTTQESAARDCVKLAAKIQHGCKVVKM